MSERPIAFVHDPASSNKRVFSQGGDAWSEVSELDGGAGYRLRIGGTFRPAWMATLCTGLSERLLSIQTAHARRSPDSGWIAELTFVALPGAGDALQVPFVELARAEANQVSPTVRLESCRVTPAAHHGGTLLLELEAEDTLGILGALLGSLATLMLFPIEMHIETRHGRAIDSLWLAGMSGAVPTTRAHEALLRLRQRWLNTAGVSD